MPVWLRAVIFIALHPAAIAGWIPLLIAGRVHAEPASHEVGLVLIATGWAVLVWCARDFALRGRGTPAAYDPPRALVTVGLYDVVRNPMYVGVLVAILGQAVWFWSGYVALYAVVVALGFHARVLLYEEPVLMRAFGAEFVRYRERVPRWFPRIWRGERAR